MFLSYLTLANFDISYIASYSCLFYPSFYGRLLLVTIAPLVVFAVLGVAYYVGKRTNCGSAEHIETIQNRHLSASLFVAFFVYSSVSSSLFQTFICDVACVFYPLKADYNISCTTSQHRSYEIYALLMVIVYPVGIPVCLGLWLVRNRKHLQTADRETMAHLQPFRSIWSTYRPSRYYYEAMEYCRRLTISMSSVYIAPNSIIR